MMNTATIDSKWNEIRGEVQQRWGRLTNSDLDEVQGQFDKLVALVQDRYGYTARRAQRDVGKFLDRYGVDTGDLQEVADDFTGRIRQAMGRYPWAFVAGALVVGFIVVGFIFKPFDN